jgi:hypothetical protein
LFHIKFFFSSTKSGSFEPPQNMFHSSQMKSFALVWTLSLMGVAALDSDQPIDQVQELIGASRELQMTCMKQSSMLKATGDALKGEAKMACTSFPCAVDFQTLKSFNGYKGACSTAKGALQLFKAVGTPRSNTKQPDGGARGLVGWCSQCRYECNS